MRHILPQANHRILAFGQLPSKVQMLVTTTITRQRAVSRPHPFNNDVSRQFRLISVPSLSTWNRTPHPRAPIPPLHRTTRRASPPQVTSAASNAYQTAANYYTRSIATFTSASGGLRRPNMAGDDEYMDFLNKANEDPSAGSTKAQASQSKELKAADAGVDMPQPLVAVTNDVFYVSDSDEPFVPVSLAWEGGEGLPDEGKSRPAHDCLRRFSL